MGAIAQIFVPRQKVVAPLLQQIDQATKDVTKLFYSIPEDTFPLYIDVRSPQLSAVGRKLRSEEFVETVSLGHAGQIIPDEAASAENARQVVLSSIGGAGKKGFDGSVLAQPVRTSLSDMHTALENARTGVEQNAKKIRNSAPIRPFATTVRLGTIATVGAVGGAYGLGRLHDRDYLGPAGRWVGETATDGWKALTEQISKVASS